MLNHYLAELEREMAQFLPAQDLPARLAEAEVHLLAGIEARVELGMTVEEAAREAMEAFGRPTVLGKAERPSVRPRLFLMLAGYIAGLAAFGIGWWIMLPRFTETLVPGIVLVWSALAIAFAVLAFRSRRPRPLAVFVTGCTASLAVTLAIGTTTVFRTGSGVLPKGRVAVVRKGIVAELDRRLDEEQKLHRDLERLDGSNGIEAFRSAHGYRVPIPASTSHWGSPLAEHDVDRADWARSDLRNAWRENAAELGRLRNDIAELDAGLAHPLENLKAIVPETMTLNVVAAAWVTFADLVFGGLGALTLRRRFRRMPHA